MVLHGVPVSELSTQRKLTLIILYYLRGFLNSGRIPIEASQDSFVACCWSTNKAMELRPCTSIINAQLAM